MFQKVGDILLHLFEMIQLELRIGNAEEIAAFAVFVDKDASAVLDHLGLHFENAFAFEHHGQDVTGASVFGGVLFDQFSKQRFGGVFLDWLRRGGWRRRIDALPMRDESFFVHGALAVLGFPAIFANVEAMISLGLVEEQSVEGLLIRKWLLTRLTGMRARLNIPINHRQSAARPPRVPGDDYPKRSRAAQSI